VDQDAAHAAEMENLRSVTSREVAGRAHYGITDSHATCLDMAWIQVCQRGRVDGGPRRVAKRPRPSSRAKP